MTGSIVTAMSLCAFIFFCGWKASESHNVGAPVERRELIRVTPDVYEVQCDAVDIWITPHDGPSALDADQIAEIIVLQDYCRAKDVVR